MTNLEAEYKLKNMQAEANLYAKTNLPIDLKNINEKLVFIAELLVDIHNQHNNY